jgi:hypothetical protein
MKNYQIAALGEFLMNYESDLRYIIAFKKIFDNPKTKTDLVIGDTGLFHDFLVEFGLLRSFNKDLQQEVFVICRDYIKTHKKKLSPDELAAIFYDDVLIGKRLLSLSSKVIFLYEPTKFIPYDSLNSRSLNLSGNTTYTNFSKALEHEFKHNKELSENLKSIKKMVLPFVKKIENNFDNSLDFEKIRENRLMDKLLRAKERYDTK